MYIEFLVSAATEYRVFQPGDQVYWEDAKDAERMVQAGHVKEVKVDAAVEKAAKDKAVGERIARKKAADEKEARGAAEKNAKRRAPAGAR